MKSELTSQFSTNGKNCIHRRAKKDTFSSKNIYSNFANIPEMGVTQVKVCNLSKTQINNKLICKGKLLMGTTLPQ